MVSDRSLPDTPCMPRLDTDLWGLGLVNTESCSAPCTNTPLLVCVAPVILSLVCLLGVPGEGTTIMCCSFTFLGLSWGPIMWW